MKMIRGSKTVRSFLGVLLMFSLFAGELPEGIVTAFAAQDNFEQENSEQENAAQKNVDRENADRENAAQENAAQENVEQNNAVQGNAAQDHAPVEEDLNGDGIFEKNADPIR